MVVHIYFDYWRDICVKFVLKKKSWIIFKVEIIFKMNISIKSYFFISSTRFGAKIVGCIIISTRNIDENIIVVCRYDCAISILI